MIAGLCLFVLALTASEQRGRDIYRSGESPSGRAITAVIGKGETTELAASVLPCGSCHGPEGRGIPEGTIEPADVRWSALSNYLVTRGRRRPRYDDALLTRAIREGHDAGEMPLSPIMPRYRIDDRDLADLVAYLHRLGNEPQPGLTDTELTIATIVPLSGPRAATGEITRTVIEKYFADVNAQGGLYGRTLKLRAVDAKQASEALTDAFAIVCASFADDTSVEAFIDRERIPLVTPLASDNASSAPSSFFLFSDLESQALALTKHVGAGTRNVYVLHDATAAARAAASAIEERAKSLQWKVRTSLDDLEKGDNDLLFLIGVDLNDTLRQLDSMQWRPEIVVAGASLTSFPSYSSKILIAVPTLPTDITIEGQREMLAFAERHKLPRTQMPTQIATYAATKTLIEGLKRAGRDLTREKLIATLETFYQFATGLTPPITYARNRHVGAVGAFIVEVDVENRTFAPVSNWIVGN
ncbi:MAG TPA: ABC transporter substrate-binding protein [Thermoanaerobaculia bacterium]|jgi:ABC-type branched-subunit amino acid transport system substrate-binding protein|nr:ABC transporter substrate-binding protein [Thermoanaerobaculia bacterium]